MNEGMILAAKRSHVKQIPNRSRQDVYQYFKFYIDKAIDAIREWENRVKPSNDLAHQLPINNAKNIQGNKLYDAVITSPPYINAIDYVWASKFELHWLGMVANDRDRLNLYSQEIGTERLDKKECQEIGKTGNLYLDQLIEDIYYGRYYQASKGQNKLRARVVYQYFLDMKIHFQKSFICLKQGGFYCFSRGDINKICGVNIPVAQLLTELASEIGFRQNFQFHLLLKNRKLNLPRNVNWAGIIQLDTVVFLKK
ncbi:hypothetical protein [Gloeothece citriformis]|uniref:hypothetical protein n=1 Tax=Gloeothece citriformis TaxID=2546356 RepID=UPI000173B9E6|nr:hypothetical protein [Gloeothece citriformis]